VSLDADFPPDACVSQGKVEIGSGKCVARPLGPFDHADPVVVAEIVHHAGIAKFTRIYESIKIKVVQV
jgi:hypothetical protein